MILADDSIMMSEGYLDTELGLGPWNGSVSMKVLNMPGFEDTTTLSWSSEYRGNSTAHEKTLASCRDYLYPTGGSKTTCLRSR